MRCVTRQYLYDRVKNADAPNFDAKLEFVRNQLLSEMHYKQNQILSLKRSFAHFKSEIKQKWVKAHYKEDVFLKFNQSWLEGTFEIPVAETTRIHNRPGRPSKSFEEVCERSKRRKTEELRSTFEKDVILHAAQVELGNLAKEMLQTSSRILQVLRNEQQKTKKHLNAIIRVINKCLLLL